MCDGFVLNGWCWDVIGCTSVTVSRDYVHPLPSLPLQDTFAKAMMPLYDFVAVVRRAAIDMVTAMEKGGQGTKVSPYAFKCLEGLRDPADFHEVVGVMTDERIKPTAMRLKAEVTRICRARWWTWILQHPKLTTEDVHPSKRMTPFCFADCSL